MPTTSAGKLDQQLSLLPLTDLFLDSAAFLGTRITLRQVSPESEPIYDFIVSLYDACKGDWKILQEQTGAD